MKVCGAFGNWFDCIWPDWEELGLSSNTNVLNSFPWVSPAPLILWDVIFCHLLRVLWWFLEWGTCTGILKGHCSDLKKGHPPSLLIVINKTLKYSYSFEHGIILWRTFQPGVIIIPVGLKRAPFCIFWELHNRTARPDWMWKFDKGLIVLKSVFMDYA